MAKAASKGKAKGKASAKAKGKSAKANGKNDKYVYSWGGGKAEGTEDQRALLGGKGANLHGMTRLGLPVPPGFTISTEVCTYFYDNKKTYPKSLEGQVKQAMVKVEKIMGKKFGDRKNPLLFSVRSGARASMPGMMDTILNLGLNDETIEGMVEKSQNPRFCYDSYRRFVMMYSDVVLDIHSDNFEHALEEMKQSRGVKLDTELSAEDLKELTYKFKEIVKSNGMEFPEDPW